jgi:hypothetical protein
VRNTDASSIKWSPTTDTSIVERVSACGRRYPYGRTEQMNACEKLARTALAPACKMIFNRNMLPIGLHSPYHKIIRVRSSL